MREKEIVKINKPDNSDIQSFPGLNVGEKGNEMFVHLPILTFIEHPLYMRHWAMY